MSLWACVVAGHLRRHQQLRISAQTISRHIRHPLNTGPRKRLGFRTPEGCYAC